MNRKFLTNLGLLLVLNLLIKPFYILGIDAEIQNRVGQDAYGLYFALINLSFIFNILIDFGINHFNNRNISQNEGLLSKHFSKLFSLKAVLALVYAFVTLLIGYMLGYFEHAFNMMALLVLNQVFVSFILFLRSNLTALQLFARDSIISVLDRMILIVGCGILLYTQATDGQFKIEWFVYMQTFAYLSTLIFALISIGAKIGKLRWDFQKSFALMIMRKSVPYALFILMGSLYNRVDGLMLDNLLANGSQEAGVYAQGFRFYEAAGMFAYLFPVLLLPLFSRMLKERETVKPLMQMSTRLLVGGGVMLSVFFWFWSDEVLNWRFVDVSDTSALSFSMLMIGFTGLCMFYTYGTLLTANANLKVMNAVSFIGLAVNLILNWFLIPMYGAVGAAFATMCTQLFAGISQYFIATRKFQLGIDKHLILQVLVFLGVFGGMNYYLKNELDLGAMGILYSIGAGAALYIVLSGLLHPRLIIERFRPKE